jgi:predicted peptidase
MKKFSLVHLIILIVFLVTISQICSTFKQKDPAWILEEDHGVFLKKVFVNADGDSLPYQILWPQNYDPKEDYPLVLFLHGAGERGVDNEVQLKHGSFLFLDSLNQITFPCIAIFPQCPEGGFWSSMKADRSVTPARFDFDYSRPIQPSLEKAIQLMRQIIQVAPVDIHKLYIMGLSMGGMGTFEVVYRYPQLWAAAIPICGGGDPDSYSKHSAQVPFWIFHGADDQVVPVKDSRRMAKRLKEQGSTVKYTEYPGVNHNSWDNAFAEPDLFRWLFDQEK